MPTVKTSNCFLPPFFWKEFVFRDQITFYPHVCQANEISQAAAENIPRIHYDHISAALGTFVLGFCVCVQGSRIFQLQPQRGGNAGHNCTEIEAYPGEKMEAAGNTFAAPYACLPLPSPPSTIALTAA